MQKPPGSKTAQANQKTAMKAKDEAKEVVEKGAVNKEMADEADTSNENNTRHR